MSTASGQRKAIRSDIVAVRKIIARDESTISKKTAPTRAEITVIVKNSVTRAITNVGLRKPLNEPITTVSMVRAIAVSAVVFSTAAIVTERSHYLKYGAGGR